MMREVQVIVSARRRSLGFRAAFGIFFLCAAIFARPQQVDIDAVLLEVIELRAEDRVEEALDRVRDLGREFETAPAWFRADLDALEATLSSLISGDAERRAGMAAAHRHGLAFEAANAAGDRATAVEELRKAAALCEEHLGPLDRETLWRRVDLAWTLGSVQDARGSKAEAEAAIRGAAEAGLDAHPLPASAQTALGFTEMKFGRTVPARAAFEAARGIWAELDPDFPRLRAQRPIPVTGLAMLENSLGDTDAADALFAEAVALTRVDPGEESASWANLLNNIGTAFLERGEPRLAEPYLRRALVAKVGLHPPGHPAVLNSLTNVAALLLSTGDYASAEELVADALPDPSAARGAELQVVSLLESLAHADASRGSFDAARDHARRAVDIGRSAFADQPALLGAPFELLIQIEISRGDLAAAQALLDELAGWTDEESAGVLAARSRLALLQDDPESAQTLGEEALAALGDAEGTFAAALRAHMGNVALTLAEVEDAEDWFLEAAEMQDAARLRAEAGLARASFGGTRQWTALAGVRAALDDGEGAWEAQERGRSRVLLELLNRAQQADGDAVDEVEPHAIADVAAALAPGEALIGWVPGTDDLGETGLWLWCLRDDGEPTWEFREGDPGAEIRGFRDALANAAFAAFPAEPDADAAAARALYDALIAPLEPALDGVTTLLAVPARPVLGIPIEALLDASGASVDERWTVAYAPSGSVLARLRESAPRTARGAIALALGDPPFRPEHREAAEESAARAARSAALERPAQPGALPRLAASGREASAIADLFPGSTLLVGIDATERAVVATDLGAFGVLHFATHALVDDERPERSALVLCQLDLLDPLRSALTEGRIDDGLLTAGDVIRGPRLSAGLVTLSACDTALGRPVPGEGYLGLADAFLQAGAQAVVASLWSVDDRASAAFMEHFYAAWREGSSRAEALRTARAALRANPATAHPGTWAAFVLIGDGR